MNITLDKYTPLMKRYVCTNQSPFMNKNLSNEIMKRSSLGDEFLNTEKEIDEKVYNINNITDLLVF